MRRFLSIFGAIIAFSALVLVVTPAETQATLEDSCTATFDNAIQGTCGSDERCGDRNATGEGICLAACDVSTETNDGTGVCKPGQTCVAIDLTDPDKGACSAKVDGTAGGAAGAGAGGGAAGGPVTGAENLQSAQQSGFGTNALRGLGLYQGRPETLLITIVRQVFLYIGAILVVLIVYGGILYMTGASGGKDGKALQGKKVITAAIVGTVIAFAAFLIAEFVIRALTA
ncbi:MAG: hypothetical protein KC653_01870 [Candidatus Andersenbacteria bacterium]|nr:hypothetical protein [Candidatus Andersenbacteria bacterium]